MNKSDTRRSSSVPGNKAKPSVNYDTAKQCKYFSSLFFFQLLPLKHSGPLAHPASGEGINQPTFTVSAMSCEVSRVPGGRRAKESGSEGQVLGQAQRWGTGTDTVHGRDHRYQRAPIAPGQHVP